MKIMSLKTREFFSRRLVVKDTGKRIVANNKYKAVQTQ